VQPPAVVLIESWPVVPSAPNGQEVFFPPCVAPPLWSIRGNGDNVNDDGMDHISHAVPFLLPAFRCHSNPKVCGGKRVGRSKGTAFSPGKASSTRRTISPPGISSRRVSIASAPSRRDPARTTLTPYRRVQEAVRKLTAEERPMLVPRSGRAPGLFGAHSPT